MELEDRKVIVVGAGSGIGRSVAVAASRAGANPFFTGAVLAVDGGGLLI